MPHASAAAAAAAAAEAAAAQLLQHHRAQVLSRYRELLRLARRLPPEQAAAARAEAATELRASRGGGEEDDPQARLDGLKRLAARVSFLRITAPRRPGDGVGAAGVVGGGGGTFVLRGGELVEGSGADRGPRVADGRISVDEAHRLNREHYKRFYGKPKPKGEMFF